MIYEAVSTHTGLVANEPYRKGLAYNERIGADERQARLGWTETLQVGRDGHVALALAERDGRAVRGLKVEGVLGRPCHQPLRRQARARRDGAGPLRGADGRGRRGQLADHARGARAGGRRADLPHAEAAMAQVTSTGGLRDCTRSARERRQRGCGRIRSRPCSRSRTCIAAAACAKSRRRLAALPGVTSARANLSARRVTAVHGAAGVNATDLVEALARAGFKAAELAEEAAGPAKPADRELLKRLGVAGFAAANIMLLSVSVWSGAAGDMTPSVQALFHWLSALIALPTVAYAGPAVLPLRRAGAARAPPQHGRADLARRDAGDGHEPLPDGARQRAGLFRRRRHAAVLPAGRPLSRPAHARARGGRGRQSHGPARRRPPRSSARTAPPSASAPACWSPACASSPSPASASPSTAACSTAAARSTRA